METIERIRRRTWQVLEIGAEGDALSRTVDLMIMTLVFGNVVAVTLASVETLRVAYEDLFWAFEKVSVAAFTAEFVARLWSVAGAPGDESATQKRIGYLRSPLAIVALLAIAPFYLSAFFNLDLRFLRILRLLRIVKLTRYSSALVRLRDVYRLQRKGLAAAFFVMSIAIVLSASLVYVVEQHAQPEDFGFTNAVELAIL